MGRLRTTDSCEIDWYVVRSGRGELDLKVVVASMEVDGVVGQKLYNMQMLPGKFGAQLNGCSSPVHVEVACTLAGTETGQESGKWTRGGWWDWLEQDRSGSCWPPQALTKGELNGKWPSACL